MQSITMARFTSIGMPKKSFVASAAEESREQPAAASESASAGQPPAKKRKRRGTRGKDPSEIAASAAAAEKSEKKRGWTRDPDVASEFGPHAHGRRVDGSRLTGRTGQAICGAFVPETGEAQRRAEHQHYLLCLPICRTRGA